MKLSRVLALNNLRIPSASGTERIIKLPFQTLPPQSHLLLRRATSPDRNDKSLHFGRQIFQTSPESFIALLLVLLLPPYVGSWFIVAHESNVAKDQFRY